MQGKYFEMVMLLERLHRLFLDVVKAELDRKQIVDITNIQCMILFNIGHSRLTVGEISNRGYYLGSNVTYNLKKMVEHGYLEQKTAAHDRRSSTVQLSPKGKVVYDLLDTMIKRHLQNMPRNNLAPEEIDMLMRTLENLESFWTFVSSRDMRF